MFQFAIPKSNTNEVAAKKFINKLFIYVFLLMIFDGAIRKWVLPSLSTPVLLMKDILVLYVYFYAIQKRLWPVKISTYVLFSIIYLFIIVFFLQIIIGGRDPFTITFGLRNYFLLIPLIFLMEAHMEWQDVKRLLRIISYILIPSAIVVIFQYLSPPTAFINRGAGLDGDEGVFTVVGNIVRPYGFFSFTTTMNIFSSFGFLVAIYNFIIPKEEKLVGKKMTLVVFFSAILHIVMSGSRTAYGMAIIIFLGIIFSAFLIIYTKTGFRLLLSTLFLSVFSVILVFTVFEENIDIMSERMANANRSEGSAIDRVIRDKFFDPSQINNELPFFGRGIGSETPAINKGKRDKYASNAIYWENEWVRVVTECGILMGFLFLLFRVVLGFSILYKSAKVLFSSRNPIPFLLIITFLQTLLFGQMSSTTTIMYFGWFCIGLTMAINKIFLSKSE